MVSAENINEEGDAENTEKEYDGPQPQYAGNTLGAGVAYNPTPEELKEQKKRERRYARQEALQMAIQSFGEEGARNYDWVTERADKFLAYIHADDSEDS